MRRKKRSKLNPEVSFSKQGKRIVLKGKGLVEIPNPRFKYRYKRKTLGGA
jgi:hypothetical protein